MGQRGKYT